MNNRVVGEMQTAMPSLTERTIAAVRAAIRNGTMVPGELYSVKQLATELGVSRSPVRDALLRLEETGMLRFERNRGFKLRPPGPTELAQIFAVRLALEVPAAGVAARLARQADLEALDTIRVTMLDAAHGNDESSFMALDQELHGTLLAISDNPFATKVVANIRDATRLVGASTTETRTLVQVYDEHLPILDAVNRQDPAAAREAMRVHLRHTCQLLVERCLAIGNEVLSGEDLLARYLPEPDAV